MFVRLLFSLALYITLPLAITGNSYLLVFNGHFIIKFIYFPSLITGDDEKCENGTLKLINCRNIGEMPFPNPFQVSE